jgi:nucleotide-binding universal stress UspA family protein
MKILLAIDGSKFSDAAIQAVTTQMRPSETVVRVLHVVETMERAYYPELVPPYPKYFGDIEKKRLTAGRSVAMKAVEKLREAGFTADSSVRTGHPRPAIVDAASKWGANLIVMGSHGRRGLDRLLLGSVSEYVARHAPCSVQVVRVRKHRR